MSTTDSGFFRSVQAFGVEKDNKSGPSETKRPPQNASDRQPLLTQFEDALAVVGQMESEAGPTLKAEFSRAKRSQAAPEIYGERQKFIRRRLGQRSGLVRLLVQEHEGGGISIDRADLYVEHMLRISANVAALSESGWPSVWSWLRSRLPMTVPDMERWKADFMAYLTEARDDLARRIPTGNPSLYTGPTPADIATAFSITTEQIRQAKANTCGLTSIDPQDRKTRDKDRKAAKRLKDGRKPQAQRTSKADMKALATRLGYSLAQIYRKRLDGTLDALVAALDRDETNVSPVNLSYPDGHFSLIDAIQAEPEEVTVADTSMKDGFTGRNITITPHWAKIYAERYPRIRDKLPCHFAEIDKIMEKTTEPYHLVVLRNLLRDRNRAAGRKMKMVA